MNGIIFGRFPIEKIEKFGPIKSEKIVNKRIKHCHLKILSYRLS
jgi:hypothetical protein